MKHLSIVVSTLALGVLGAIGMFANGHGDHSQSSLDLERAYQLEFFSPASKLLSRVDSDKNTSMPRSPRVVDYHIDAHLNSETKTITGLETLSYHNFTSQSLNTFPFHLYLNAFQPKSTWMREARRDNKGAAEYLDHKYFGSIIIKSFEIEGLGDFTKQMEFIASDDGNADDRTVVQVKLPMSVPPGGNVTFKINFESKLPQIVARTGYRNSFVMAGQWFPKVGVWWHRAWNCHQFHYATEFFADFGVFDVKLTLPQSYVVGATGEEVARTSNSDGSITYEYHAEDVHDFAWTADPGFVQVDDAWRATSGHLVHIKLLLQPQHLDQAHRHLEIVKQSFDRFDRWYGPYPYNTLTVVDPEDFGPGGTAGGMEYPTLITGDTIAHIPRRLLGLPEVALEHELGHQYWYGMVATNEFEDPWLDEGINSYTEKVMDDIYGKETSIINNLLGVNLGEHGYQRWLFLSGPPSDPLVRRGWEFMDRGSYARITYAKTATVLATLEGIIGEQRLQEALHVYFIRYRFTHPSREDFLQTIEEVSGTNLRWYFDQAVYGTQVLDYEVRKVSFERLTVQTGFPGTYRNEVVLGRKGDFIFPVTLEIKFSNGETLREHWDGRDRWIRFVYDKTAKVESAEIDPDHQVLLDVDFFNNSKTITTHSLASNKISNYWMFVTQCLSQLMS